MRARRLAILIVIALAAAGCARKPAAQAPPAPTPPPAQFPATPAPTQPPAAEAPAPPPQAEASPAAQAPAQMPEPQATPALPPQPEAAAPSPATQPAAPTQVGPPQPAAPSPAPGATGESPPEGAPVKKPELPWGLGFGNPEWAKANGAKATPLALNEFTDIKYMSDDLQNQHWFRVKVETATPVVLRVGVLNTGGGSYIHVFDETGAYIDVIEIRRKQNRVLDWSAWHGWVSAGTYFILFQEYRSNPRGKPFAASIFPMIDSVGPGKTPQQAAQLGLNYLEMEAPAWQNQYQCNGCHVQSQALMGMAVAKKNGYVVQDRSALALGKFMATQRVPEDQKASSLHEKDLFAALAHRYYISGFASQKELLLETAKAIADRAPQGYAFDSGSRRPIEAGTVTGSSMVVQVLAEALRTAPPESQAAIKRVLDGAVAHLRTAPAKTVQDHVMKIVAFREAGVKRELLTREATALLKLQNADGGFGELAQGGPSNAYGTGQALYGLKVAGRSVRSREFERAVKWLVFNQLWNGAWPLKGSKLENDLAPTMWAVIGLAGSIRAEGEPNVGDLQVKFAPEVQAISRNLEIILDASGSMNTKLGRSTRWKTAQQVLADLVRQLPADINVSLRVFGHRMGGPASCKDTELLVPPGPVNAAAIIGKVNALKARGETPLVANLLLAGRDLAAARAGTVVAITDGEESCGGDVKSVAAQLQAQGVQLVVNIVGFNLPTAKAVADWKAVAQSTGGRFFDAKTAGDLSAALREAVGLEYVVYDQAGQEVARGQVGETVELPEGTYTVVVRAGVPVKVEGVKVRAKEPTTLVLRRQGAGWTLQPERPK